MTRVRGNRKATKSPEPAKPAKPAEPIKAKEWVELDETEEMEEEVEYEEIEEEVEEEVEEVIEEEEQDDDEEKALAANENNANTNGAGDDDLEKVNGGEDENLKHTELLSLPPHGSEVYIGNIPSDISEGELKSFCKSVGEVVEVRLMKGKDSSENRGYAFVTFMTKELASKAIKDLNNADLKGKKIKCSTSQQKHKLFIGNVPRNWMEVDMKQAVEKVGPGVTKVELLKDPQNSSRNRGFAFVEYYNHACAEYSRKKMSSPAFKLDSDAPTVSWADPKSGDSASSSQVKAIYVKNLPKDVTEEQLKKLFERHGKITKVILPPAKSGYENRYGFVHFAERPMAMKALKNTERYEINGQVLDCSLAKPQAERKDNPPSNVNKVPLLPSYTPLGYGLAHGAYGALPAAVPQQMMFGNGLMPGAAMVPMILPDGRLGYVVQQPGAPAAHHGVGGSQRGGSSGSRQNRDGGRGKRYKPY